MSDYANLQKHSQGYLKSFFDSFIGTVVDLTQKFNKLNPQFLSSPDKVKAGMRNMGERLAKTLFQSGASEVLGSPDLDAKNLDEAILKNDFELIKGIRDLQGFLTKKGIEKFLHLVMVEKDERSQDLMKIFFNYFIKSSNQGLDMKDLIEEDIDGLNKINSHEAFPMQFPVYFNADIDTVWQELLTNSKAAKPDYSAGNLKIVPDLKEFFGPIATAPKPFFKREVNSKDQSLSSHYKERASHLNTLFASKQKVPVVKLLELVEKKLFQAEISIADAAKFIHYLRKIVEPLKEKLTTDYDTWFKSYTDLHLPADHS